eukprot:322813-Pleurochrysis_carterae.AAC.1
MPVSFCLTTSPSSSRPAACIPRRVPPHVHQLNGVADRAIRSIMELTRSSLVASGSPIAFWDYAVSHAVDILNRTSGPPNTNASSYELLTGEKPRIMSILPFGCSAYAVNPDPHSPRRRWTHAPGLASTSAAAAARRGPTTSACPLPTALSTPQTSISASDTFPGSPPNDI